ncbi:MAG: metal ABC transporter permease [bacterium]
MFDLMLPALAACFILTGIHAYLGIHVVERKVIFVDLSLAQVAALGAVIASLFKMDIHGNGAYMMSLSFTFIGAAVFSLARTRDDKIPQEAIIGIVYAVSTSLAILVLSKSAEAAEHLQEMLVGNILFVSWHDNLKILILYGVIGLFHVVFRKQFVMVSFALDEAVNRKFKVRFWDFLFYITFGFVVTSSVRIAGVLLVFSFLVVPAVCGVMFAGSIWKRLLVGWTVGLLTSCLGTYGSVKFDFPTGASVVCAFGLVLLALAPVKIMLFRVGAQHKIGNQAL